jgi:hypothetical protein
MMYTHETPRYADVDLSTILGASCMTPIAYGDKIKVVVCVVATG